MNRARVSVPRWVHGALNDPAYHLTVNDRVTLCGQVIEKLVRSKDPYPEPACFSCEHAFEARWQ